MACEVEELFACILDVLNCVEESGSCERFSLAGRCEGEVKQPPTNHRILLES